MFFIDRRVLFPFIGVGKKYKSDFEISTSEGRLVLKQRDREAQYTEDIEPAGYPSAKPSKGDTIEFDPQCQKVIQAALVAASKNEREPEIACVHIGKDGTVRSTDNAVMFISKTDSSFAKAFPIPNFSVPLISTANSLYVNDDAMTMVFDGIGHICSPISDDARDHFRYDLFEAQLKAFVDVPVQISMKLKLFHKLVVGQYDSYTSNLDKPAFLNITPSKDKKPTFDFSIHIRGGETTFLGKSIKASSTACRAEQSVSARRFAHVAAMLSVLHGPDATVALKFTSKSHLLLEVEQTKVFMSRALPGEPGVA